MKIANGVMMIGDVTIPVTDVRLEYRPPKADERTRAYVPKPMNFSLSVTWDFNPVILADYLAALESRRWSDYITRKFRGMPGMRFADLMRGPGRN